MRVPYANEDWVVALREKLVSNLTRVIFGPMEAYLGTLNLTLTLTLTPTPTLVEP